MITLFHLFGAYFIFPFQFAKESLTQGNIPHGECVICKDGFSEAENFTKTQCYHYFHCHCLFCYVEHSEQELEEEYQLAVQRSPHMNIERKPVIYQSVHVAFSV
jgi:E3 ubiquitin-protein ligase RNF25